MTKFRVKVYAIESYEEEIEAESEHQAQEIFIDKYDNDDVESAESNLLFETDEGFEMIREIVENSGEIEEDFED
ncbi:MAG: hypothetical protein WC781_01800 [Candidatus Pacearchaeota archaeon]|jgi:hypothetical protein